MNELIEHLEYGKILIYFSLAAIIITYITHFIFKRLVYLKYIPGLLLILVGLYNLLNVGRDFISDESINYILFFMISFISGIIGILSALIIGVFNKEKKRKNKDSKNEQMDD